MRELKQRIGADGYIFVTLGTNLSGRQTVCVHRIVADAFIGKPGKDYEVNHIDYDRTNNRIENLEYVTHKENVAHSSIAGRYKKMSGETNIKAVFTENDVLNIRLDFSNGLKISEITKKYNSKYSTIFNIVKNKTWKYLSHTGPETIGDECTRVR